MGGGCADFWMAWQLNLSGLVGGLIACPRRTWRAFVRGRHSRNLYRGAAYDGALLERRVGEVRRELGLDGELPPARAGDAAALALAAAAGVVVGGVMFVLMVPIAVVANVAALCLRRPGRSVA